MVPTRVLELTRYHTSSTAADAEFEPRSVQPGSVSYAADQPVAINSWTLQLV